MKRISKKFKKQSNSSLTITDTLGTDPEPASSISTITADPMPSAVCSAATAGIPVIHPSGIVTSHELQVAASVSGLAVKGALSAPGVIMRAESGPTMKSGLDPLAQHQVDDDEHRAAGPFSSDRHQMVEEWSKLDKEEVNRSSQIRATQISIAAEGALKHVGDSARQAEIKAAFLDLSILESQYIVLAGFNEALIRSGFGYMEEIHVFCCVEIPHSSKLLTKLGKVLMPYPGIIFTPASGYKTPVFRDDGTIWDYDDLSLDRTKQYFDIHAKDILHSELNAFMNLAESQPEISVTGLGCSEGNGDNGGAGEGKGGHGKFDDDGERNSNSGDNNNPGDSNPGDDPEDPEDTENGDSLTPGISFQTQAKIFKGTNKSSSSEPSQVLGMNGKLVVQVIPGQLKPRQLPKSHLEFRKLNFHGRASAGPAYEQVHVRVEIDVKDRNTTINVLQPLQTPTYNQRTKETRGKKVTVGGIVAGIVGFVKPTATVSVSGSRSKEVSPITEGTKNNSRITVDSSEGVAAWGFCVDDENERRAGIGFGSQRALPSVDFKFFGPSDDGPPPPIPEHFEVSIKSCWSLLRGRDGYTTSDWFSSWFKGLGPLGMAASKVPLYSNLFQAVILEVPSNLSQKTLFQSVSEVNESGVNTVVE